MRLARGCPKGATIWQRRGAPLKREYADSLYARDSTMPSSAEDPKMRDGDFETRHTAGTARAPCATSATAKSCIRQWVHGKRPGRCTSNNRGWRMQLQREGPPLRVWDVGLGAGTNAVAALTCARELGERQRRELEVLSFEIDLAPLRLALADT